jgi:hypothetical protein
VQIYALRRAPETQFDMRGAEQISMPAPKDLTKVNTM